MLPKWKSQSYVLRGSYQQTDYGMLWVGPTATLRTQAGGTADSKSFREGVKVLRYDVQNRSGSTCAVGPAMRIANRFWKAGQWTGGVYVDDTTDAQDLGAGDFLVVSLTNQDGFIVACEIPFDWVSLYISTAPTSADPLVAAVSYSNYAGTGWAAADNVTTTSVFLNDIRTGSLEVGEHNFVWTPRSDWGKVTSLDSVPAGYYALAFGWPTAPTSTTALATAMEIGVGIFAEGVADNTIYAAEELEWYVPEADGVCAFYGVSHTANRAYVEARTWG